MRLLPKSIHWCRRYPTKFNSGRDIPLAFVAGLFVYVAVLDRLGFVVATTMLASGVVALFSGPIRRGLVLSFLLSLSIFALFTYVLSIPLPRGF